MSPTSAWSVFATINSRTYHMIWRSQIWIYNELAQIKNIELIHMYVLWMTTAESDDLCFLYCTGSMKSLMREAVLALYFRLVPLLRLQIKSPQIVEVWAARFSSHNDHESVNQCGSMVGSGSRQVKLIDLFIVLLIVHRTFDKFGHIYRPLWRLQLAAIWLLDEWICIIVFFF